MKRWFFGILAAALLALPTLASAQSVILQAGPPAPRRAPMYIGQGSTQPVVQDSGPASGGALGLGLAEQLLVGFSPTNTYPAANTGTGPNGTNWCDYDAPTTNPTGYHYLCLGANADGGGLITYGSAGSATPLPLQFLINGVSFSFPLSISSLNPIAANTVIGNPTNASAVPQAIPLSNCLNALTYVAGTGFGCNTLAGTGTVTQVAMTVPSIFALTGSPITASGTLALSLANQNANTVFAGPASGSAAAPSFRALVSADIPPLSGANFPSQSANTFFGGPSSGSATQPAFRALVNGDLPALPNNDIYANTSGSSGAPAATALTSLFDSVCSTSVGQFWVRMTGAWGCSSLGYIDPRWYGAACNNSTDDTTTFGNALTAALSANLPIQLPSTGFCLVTQAGNGYSLASTGTIIIKGFGYGISGIRNSSPTGWLFNWLSNSAIQFSDWEYSQTGTPSAGGLITDANRGTSGGTGSFVSNFECFNVFNCFAFTDINIWTVQNSLFLNNYNVSIEIADTSSADAGDEDIIGSQFVFNQGGICAPTGEAVQQLSAGALKMVADEVSCGLRAYDLEAEGSSSVLKIVADSFENQFGASIFMQQAITSITWANVTIADDEIRPINSGSVGVEVFGPSQWISNLAVGFNTGAIPAGTGPWFEIWYVTGFTFIGNAISSDGGSNLLIMQQSGGCVHGTIANNQLSTETISGTCSS